MHLQISGPCRETRFASRLFGVAVGGTLERADGRALAMDMLRRAVYP